MSSIQAPVNLSKVRPWNNTWTVQAKVLIAWKQYTAQTGETLEMVLSIEKVINFWFCYYVFNLV